MGQKYCSKLPYVFGLLTMFKNTFAANCGIKFFHHFNVLCTFPYGGMWVIVRRHQKQEACIAQLVDRHDGILDIRGSTPPAQKCFARDFGAVGHTRLMFRQLDLLFHI
jgi:hypothetical protein